MTLFVYDQDRIAFSESIKGALNSLCSSSFIRDFRKTSKGQETAKKVFDDLGILEFSEDESCTLSDLSLVAKEIGVALAPSEIIHRAFIDGLAKRSLGLKDIAEPSYFGFEIPQQKGVHFIPSDSCKTVFEISGEGLLGQSAIEVFKISKETFTLHDSIDLTDGSFRVDNVSSAKTKLSSEQSVSLKNGLLVLLSAELCGILEKIIAMTTEYVKTRKQFGVAIGSFQAVSHQLSDCFLVSESAWSLVECAAHSADEFTVKSAALYCCDNIPAAIETALQLHGGIGFTWEYDLHLYLRRARKIAALVNPSSEDYKELLDLVV